MLVAVAILGCFLILNRQEEPQFDGQSLSEWLIIYAKNAGDGEGKSKPEAEKAKQAIRNIGTNGIPTLLKLIQYEPSPRRLKIANAVEKLPRFMWDNRLVRGVFSDPVDKSTQAAENATLAFLIMRSGASVAVPALTQLMCQTNRVTVANRATYCLAAIGKEGLPSLLIALANPQLPCCQVAARDLGIGPPFDFGTNAEAAIPLLANLTSNTNESLVKSAIRALGRVHAYPQVAVPALTNALRSTSSVVRWEAEHAISYFGTNAVCAVPLLLESLADGNYTIRSAATNALLQIAPQTLK